MIIQFSFLLLGLVYLCYKTKDEMYEMNTQTTSEKEDYKGIEDLFI